LPEEKRQLLEGLFDLAHDPILQHQVLNNPAFSRILNAATRIPMSSSITEERERLRLEHSQRSQSYHNNLRGSTSAFPEVQGTLVFDTTQSAAGWSVMIRASLPSVPSNHSFNTMVSDSSSNTSNAPTEPAFQPNMFNTQQFSMPGDTQQLTNNETLFQRVFAYVSSLWHWLWPDYHRREASVSTPSSSSTSAATTTTPSVNTIPPERINRIKMWSILGTTMIMLALGLLLALCFSTFFFFFFLEKL